jgi:hypothetical protein
MNPDGSPKKSMLSSMNPFTGTGVLMGSLILCIFFMMVIVTICSVFGAAASDYIKKQTLHAAHFAGKLMSKTGHLTSAVGDAIAKNTFSVAPIGETMYPYISPAAYGNGVLPAFALGSGLSDSIATGQSWNPPNVGGCDCNSSGVFSTVFTSSMPNLSDGRGISVLPTSKNAESAASDQAAFYAALNGTGSMENAINGLSDSQLKTDLSAMVDDGMNQYGVNSSGMF